MGYKTILYIDRQNQLILLETIFNQYNIRYRFLDKSARPNFPLGVRVQVEEGDLKRAQALLKEHGLLQETGNKDGSAVSMARFWLWMVITLILLIVISVIIKVWLF
ncbi:hypothetical protein [Salinimicrobium xinjiangense]|uniref:hypothetical protein n=1 Tax=Salinimicrobium xinjiangense TaxID=438596 RepID=UPI000408B6F3|nr:hypothetical protein [Salinimicrobium xinjiangense]